MKWWLKYAIILLSLLTLGIVFAVEANAQDMVTLDTPFDREVTLTIPDDFKELRSLTIEVAELYWGERYDLEETLENNEKLQRELQNIIDNAVSELKGQNDELVSLLDEKLRPEPARPLVDLSLGVSIDSTVSGSLGVGILFFDKFIARAYASYPFVIGISVGLLQ